MKKKDLLNLLVDAKKSARKNGEYVVLGMNGSKFILDDVMSDGRGDFIKLKMLNNDYHLTEYFVNINHITYINKIKRGKENL